ncbi:thioredoxin family protein [Rufibacter quisquiliarum]|uniref:Thioredoxin-related protein n=2 Tax=Rufibacter TaxID=1379908 RepID=A0A839GVG5_9BACT|nr:DUF255 domain-containing protein [Rufibacter quisquiliarum]MBA9078736.1 thioredoxin-related protein [Rufibacter quisquiliarum]
MYLLLFILTFIPFKDQPPLPKEASGPASVAAPKAKVEWLTLPEALERSKKHPKKILIDVYTDWCGWCKKMDKQVYADPAVANKLAQDYYVVKLNAEQRQPITVNGTTYQYLEKYKAHELALSLLQGQMSYPCTVVLNEKLQVMQRVPGFVPAKDFLRVLA